MEIDCHNRSVHRYIKGGGGGGGNLNYRFGAVAKGLLRTIFFDKLF